MKLCASCKQKVDDTTKQCPYCGSQKFLVPKPKKEVQHNNEQIVKQSQQAPQENTVNIQKPVKNVKPNNNGANVKPNQKQVKPGKNIQKDQKPKKAPMNDDGLGEYISVKDWVILMLLLTIPIVNLVVLISGIKNPSTLPIKRNYLVAYISFAIISFIISIIIAAILNSTGIVYSFL